MRTIHKEMLGGLEEAEVAVSDLLFGLSHLSLHYRKRIPPSCLPINFKGAAQLMVPTNHR